MPAPMTAVSAPPFRIGDRVSFDNIAGFAAWAIERAEAAMDRTVAAARVGLRGLDLAVHSQNAAYVELVRERLSGAGVASDQGESCRILITSPDKDGMAVPPVWGDEAFNSRFVEKALAATPFRAEFDQDLRFWQIFDIRRNIGVQWMQSERAYPNWEPGSPLRVFLHWFYSARGMRLAHAGTLGKNGRGVLLIGRGGSGKSGTVAGGVLNGLQTVGDDYVLLDNTGGFPKAYPVFRTLKQDARGLRRLGVYDSIATDRRPNWQDKYEFFCDDLGGTQMTTSLEIRAMLVPHVAAAERSELTPMSQAKAMLALAPSGLFQMPGERDNGVARFAELVRSLPCFSLSLGGQGGEVSRAISDFLDGLR